MTRWKMHRRVLLLFLGMAVPNFIVIWSRLNCFTASYYSDPLSGSHILGIDHLYTHMVTSWWMKLAIDYATRIWMHRDRWRMMIWSLSFVIFAYGHPAESKRVAQSLESAPHKNKKKKLIEDLFVVWTQSHSPPVLFSAVYSRALMAFFTLGLWLIAPRWVRFSFVAVWV